MIKLLLFILFFFSSTTYTIPFYIKKILLSQNERLIFQVQNLRSALEDREGKIQELRTVVNGYADISETNRLKDEISALKQRNSKCIN